VNLNAVPQVQTSWRCAWDARCALGEGPVWDVRRAKLWFVDLKGDALLSWSEAEGGRTFPFPGGPSVVVPILGADDLLCVTRSGLERWRPEGGARRLVGRFEHEPPGNRPNDGKCDPSGRLWVGTMDDAEAAFSGTLYRFDSSGAPMAVAGSVGVSNGLGWSPSADVFYYTDSLRRRIWRAAFDLASGDLGPLEVFVDVETGTGAPDGLAVDSEGFVWSAHWDGWRITRYDPDGAVDRIIPFPGPRPTSLCFGGSDLRTLYVTSARTGLSDAVLAQAGQAGGLFAMESDVPGLPAMPARLS
jgi:sugar lactone lactonase YvrE